MSNLWLHVEVVPDAGATVEIDREEARHAFGARRLSAGDLVTLFDGRGTVAHARLLGERSRRGDALVEVVDRSYAAPLEPEVTVAFAVPKGDRLSTLLDLATQSGVSRFVPIVCARSVVDTEKLERSERFHRIVLEATKVAKRAWTAELAAGGSLFEMLAAERARGAAVAIAHTSDAVPIRAWLATLATNQPRTVCIGPEGGFDDTEITEARAQGIPFVSLGPCVMRIEAAAIAAATLLRA